MEAVSDIRNRYGSAALAVAVVVGILLVLLGYKPVAKGFVLGTLFSILNFVLIAEFLPRTLGRTQRQTFLFSLLSIAFRFSLLAVPLILSLRSEAFSVTGVVPGLLMVQGTIFADHLYRLAADRRKPPA
jgi:ATP synthase protein I